MSNFTSAARADLVAEPFWYAVYVKPRHEKSVTVSLQGKGIECFLPTYTRRHKEGRHFELPLFPGYVFCRFHAYESLPIVSTPGVYTILKDANGPSPISADEIQAIKTMLATGIDPQPWPSFVSEGQEIDIHAGPLRGVRGVVLDAKGEKWLVVSIRLLQRSVAVKIDRMTLNFGAISSVNVPYSAA